MMFHWGFVFRKWKISHDSLYSPDSSDSPCATSINTQAETHTAGWSRGIAYSVSSIPTMSTELTYYVLAETCPPLSDVVWCVGTKTQQQLRAHRPVQLWVAISSTLGGFYLKYYRGKEWKPQAQTYTNTYKIAKVAISASSKTFYSHSEDQPTLQHYTTGKMRGKSQQWSPDDNARVTKRRFWNLTS